MMLMLAVFMALSLKPILERAVAKFSDGRPIPESFVGSEMARKIARPIRGCATDDQYVELLWNIDDELKTLRLEIARLKSDRRDMLEELEGR